VTYSWRLNANLLTSDIVRNPSLGAPPQAICEPTPPAPSPPRQDIHEPNPPASSPPGNAGSGLREPTPPAPSPPRQDIREPTHLLHPLLAMLDPDYMSRPHQLRLRLGKISVSRPPLLCPHQLHPLPPPTLKWMLMHP
jgi:hypothetical protein